MTKRKLVLLVVAVAAFAISFVTALRSAPASRFDDHVRNQFFAAFTGDRAALDQALRTCEAVLAEQPKHAEAMVWYGAGLFYLSGLSFQGGDREKGMELYERGLRTMDEAVALAPDHPGVRIPRGAVLLTSTRYMPPYPGKELLAKALSDYEHVLELQRSTFDKLGTHPRGELLFGLAEGWSRAGDASKAAGYFTRVVKELPGTPYEKRAEKWLRDKSLPVGETGCIGCHAGN